MAQATRGFLNSFPIVLEVCIKKVAHYQQREAFFMAKYILLPLVFWPEDRIEGLEEWLKENTLSFRPPFKTAITTRYFSLSPEDFQKFQEKYPRANFSGLVPRYDYTVSDVDFFGFFHR